MRLRKITVLLVCTVAVITLLTGCKSDEKNRTPVPSDLSGKPIEKENEPITEFPYKNQNN